MRCQKCGGEYSIPETRNLDTVTYRKRKCQGCGNIIYTKEIVADEESKRAITEWIRERGRKFRAHQKGVEYISPEQGHTPRNNTSPLF